MFRFLRDRGSILGLGAALAIAGGAMASQGASASVLLKAIPNPVTVASGASSATTSISWDTGGPHVLAQLIQEPGGSQLVNAGAETGSVQATVYCNKTNTFTLKDWVVGTTLATMTVDVNGCSSSGGGGGVVVPGPNPCILLPGGCNPAPKLPANLVLSPNASWYSYKSHHEENDPFYCFQTNGYGPDLTTSFPNAAVGFEHYNDPGTQPFPCWNWTDTFYRGAVQFDWNQVNSYVQAHGIKSATLTYSASQGSVSCVSQIQENSDDVATYNPFPDVLPGGSSLTPAPQNVSGGASVDLAGVLAFGQIFGGIDPHMHFVFIGKDESLSEQDNNVCNAVLGNFKLTVAPDH